MKISGVNILGSRILNDDAFDICNSSDVEISNVFARVQDDVIAVKGIITFKALRTYIYPRFNLLDGQRERLQNRL